MIDTLISLIYEKLSLFQKILFIIIFLSFCWSSYMFIKRSYLKNLRLCNISYWLSGGFFVVLILCLLFSETVSLLGNQIVIISLSGLYFASLIASTIFPIMKYGKGLKIHLEKEIHVPLSGEKIELRFENNSPLNDEIEIGGNLPNNIEFNNTKKVNKVFRLLSNKKLSVSFKVYPSKNKIRNKMFIYVKSNVFGKFTKEIDIIT